MCKPGITSCFVESVLILFAFGCNGCIVANLKNNWMGLMNIITNKNRIMIFSDFHWGKGRNSELKLEANKNFIDWFIDQCKQNECNTVLFMGDWHEVREEVSVKTYNYSYNSLVKMSNAGLRVHMIVGNHDAYYANNVDTNSINAFSEINNVYIYTKTTHMSVDGLRIGLYPWAFDTKEVQSSTIRDEVAFGHFEFIGGQFNHVSHCKHGDYDSTWITDYCAPLSFSGHFHMRKEYSTKTGKVVVVGCPLELDWSDRNTNKGICLFHTDSKAYEFIDNNITPKHIAISLNAVRNGDTSWARQIKGNYCRLVIDSDYQFEQVTKLITGINKLNPLVPCDLEYVSSMTHSSKSIMDESEEDKPLVAMSKYDCLVKYIDDEKLPDGIDMKTIHALAKHYFDKAGVE